MPKKFPPIEMTFDVLPPAKEIQELTPEQTESELQHKMAQLALGATENAIAHLAELTGLESAQVATAASNSFVTLKKARNSGFQEIPDLKILVDLERLLRVPSTETIQDKDDRT